MSYHRKIADLAIGKIDEAYLAASKFQGGELLPVAALDQLLVKLADARTLVSETAARMRIVMDEHDAIRLRSLSFCHVCWTSSYAPCEQEFTGAVPAGKEGGWMYCKMCHAEEEIRSLRES